MHSCPDCGAACYCGGDIDDCEAGDVEAEINCDHCLHDDHSELDVDPLTDPAYAMASKPRGTKA